MFDELMPLSVSNEHVVKTINGIQIHARSLRALRGGLADR
jgi:hypothetical protein